MDKQITLGDLITQEEAEALRAYLEKQPRGIGRTVHNLVMRWLDNQPKVMERFRVHGVIKPFGAYLLEHHLRLK